MAIFEDFVIWQKRTYRVKYKVEDRDIVVESIYNMSKDCDTEMKQLDLNRFCYHALMARNLFGKKNRVTLT